MDRPVTVSHIHIIAPKIDASTPDGLAAAFRHGTTECLMNAEELASGKTANLTGHYIVTLHALELALAVFEKPSPWRECRDSVFCHESAAAGMRGTL
jgi:hypothetical protein